jgi:phage host-nuclease inhibitor protein Gam
VGRKTPSRAAKSYPPIASREEADTVIREIGTLLRAKNQFEATLEEKVAELKAETSAAVKPIADTLAAKLDALHAWAEANRAELLKDGARSVAFPQGRLGWRWNPAAVRLSGDEAEIVATLERLALGDLVRVAKAVNKEAILEAPERVEGIAGIKVAQSEQFWVKPAEIEVEQAKTSRTLRGKDVAASAPAAANGGGAVRQLDLEDVIRARSV